MFAIYQWGVEIEQIVQTFLQNLLFAIYQWGVEILFFQFWWKLRYWVRNLPMRSWNYVPFNLFPFFVKSSQFTNEELKFVRVYSHKLYDRGSQFTNEELKFVFPQAIYPILFRSQFTNEELKWPFMNSLKEKFFVVRNLPMRSWNI